MLNILKFKVPILSLFFLISHYSNACTLTIGVAKSFPPYHINNADGSWGGISIDIARALVNGANCQLNVKEVPWLRSIKLLEKGDIHLLSNYTQNNVRNKFSQFIGPHHIEKVVLIAHQAVSPNVNSADLLSEFDGRIGITRGNSFGNDFDKNILSKGHVKDKLVYIKNTINRHRMLFTGRIDAMFDDELSALYLLAKDKETSKKFDIRFSLKANPVYFGISVKTLGKQLQTKLNDSWLKIIDSHTLSEIYQTYGVTLDHNELVAYPTVLINTH